MADLLHSHSRSSRLDRVLADLLAQAPELQAAAVVSFDGLPMASALPSDMDEDRVAAMSAALLSLGERAAESFGRGSLSQVYVEGENGTVFLVSADDEAVLVAVGAKGAKVGLMLFEVRRSAAKVALALRADDAALAADLASAEAEAEAEASAVSVAGVEEAAVEADGAADGHGGRHTDWRTEPVASVAPTLHVVEGGSQDQPQPYIYPVPTAAPVPEPAYDQPYAPYAEQSSTAARPGPEQPAPEPPGLAQPDPEQPGPEQPGLAPPGPSSPWGSPMSPGGAEANGWAKNDLGSWTNYAPGSKNPPGPADNWS